MSPRNFLFERAIQDFHWLLIRCVSSILGPAETSSLLTNYIWLLSNEVTQLSSTHGVRKRFDRGLTGLVLGTP